MFGMESTILLKGSMRLPFLKMKTQFFFFFFSDGIDFLYHSTSSV